MSQPTPPINLYGAVDLSSLARPAAAPPNGPGAPAEGGTVPGPVVVDVTEATFGEAVQRSTQVPVVLVLTSPRSPASGELTDVLRTLARDYGGRFQLAVVDADASPQIAAAVQVQSVPTVIAVVAGQPIPLFQGVYPEAQLRQVLDEVLRVAAQNGITGVMAGSEEDEADAEAAPAEPELPPLHAEALAAIERGDLAAAEDAYTRALKQNPGDADAHAALLQVRLMARVEARDPRTVLTEAAAAAPGDVDIQLAAADVEAAAGRFDAAFDRLLGAVAATAGEDRETVRRRLVELFEIAGNEHPDVAPARRRLTSLLY
ncbi:tetratricopeptide repeat protein [Georgenia sp. TF02-10]|uniref:tetratricopeptide repeat protein n=1 Tax=Georgenia sp. TF02-10 TaxID=2917725 RepID=UPI001FA6B47E|nr:tetratricopeptide repeat protein [Georgenia sp. TF02-10]UNX53964.1 tetratricopeptide repeat protein [Georgenia sp. TF02-10]